MPVPDPSPPQVRFRQFQLDLASGELHKDDQKIPLPPKAFGVLRALVEVTGKDVEACDPEEILHAVQQREEQGSTFFSEGVAFPHARIEGISTPIVALGLTRQGILDGSPGKPIELVFLILSPADMPAVQVQCLALVSRVAKDRQLTESLATVSSPEEAFELIRDWETLQKPGAAAIAHS